MSKVTQIAFIEKEIRTAGFYTRNQALGNYITRLSSIIQYLNDSGYVIKGKTKPLGTKTRWGNAKDYQYEIIFKPASPVFYEEEVK